MSQLLQQTGSDRLSFIGTTEVGEIGGKTHKQATCVTQLHNARIQNYWMLNAHVSEGILQYLSRQETCIYRDPAERSDL